jgi:hypothetical protein
MAVAAGGSDTWKAKTLTGSRVQVTGLPAAVITNPATRARRLRPVGA